MIENDTLYDVVHETSLTHLKELKLSMGGDVLDFEHVSGVCEQIDRSDGALPCLEFTTTYRSEVFPAISDVILKADNPPEHFAIMIHAMTDAAIDETNNRYRSSLLLRPERSELTGRLQEFWLKACAETQDSDVTLYQTSESFPLEVVLSHYAGVLSLGYSVSKRQALLFWQD